MLVRKIYFLKITAIIRFTLISIPFHIKDTDIFQIKSIQL